MLIADEQVSLPAVVVPCSSSLCDCNSCLMLHDVHHILEGSDTALLTSTSVDRRVVQLGLGHSRQHDKIWKPMASQVQCLNIDMGHSWGVLPECAESASFLSQSESKSCGRCEVHSFFTGPMVCE